MLTHTQSYTSSVPLHLLYSCTRCPCTLCSLHLVYPWHYVPAPCLFLHSVPCMSPCTCIPCSLPPAPCGEHLTVSVSWQLLVPANYITMTRHYDLLSQAFVYPGLPGHNFVKYSTNHQYLTSQHRHMHTRQCC